MDKVQSLSKASKDLMLKEPYYGFFLIMLNKLWDSKRVPTAGVSKNGINYQLAINPEFWEGLNEDQRLGILKHELLHIAFGHLTTFFKFSDKRLANVAMDMEINQYIEKSWLPGGEYTKEEYEALNEKLKLEMSAAMETGASPEEIAEILKNGTCGNQAMDDLLDNIEMSNVPNHETWEEFDNLTEAEQKLIEKQLQKVLSDAKEQTEKKRGTVPGEISGLIIVEQIEAPKFDWRGYIRRFTGISTKVFTKKIRRKENRRFSDNPGLKIKMKQHMLLAIDTSGSVSDSELKEFMNEIHHIYKAGVDITIVQCDTKIHSIKAYTGKHEMNIHGRGGTEFDPVLEYYNENLKKYTSLVYFTDGECGYSVKPKGNILWVLSEQSYMNKDLPGKVIKLEL